MGRRDDDRVSLAPLDAEEALRALLRVKPEDSRTSPQLEQYGGPADDGIEDHPED